MNRILSIFQRSPEKQIAKLRKKVKEPHGESSVRMSAAERLFEMGSPEALRALLDRFTINVSPSIEDEREKEQVYVWLQQHGRRAVDPILHFLKNERSVYWPLKTLKAILNEQDLTRTLNDILRFHWENPPAISDPKAQIIRFLDGLHSPELEETVRLYLQDEDDDVLLAAVRYLLTRPEEDGREAILQCFVDSEDRPRIRSQILEYLAEKQWTVKGFRPVVEENLPPDYNLTRDGRLKKVGSSR